MSSRDRMIVAAICLAVAIVAPYLLVISPKRAQVSSLNKRVSSVQSQLQSVQAQLAAGNQARAAFASSYTTLVRLGEAVPTDDNTPSLIYQLQGAAKASDVDFDSLTFNAGSSTPVSNPTPTGSTPSSSSSASSAQTASTALPPGATIGPAGFPIEPFTFTFGGNFFHLANFLGRLQRFVQASNQRLSVSGRLMTLNSISLGSGSSGFPQISATISATTYLLPASEGLLNGATPGGPAPSGTQTVSNSTPTTTAPPAVITSPVK
jgi:Type II secretion system (T2SS), protein M